MGHLSPGSSASLGPAKASCHSQTCPHLLLHTGGSRLSTIATVPKTLHPPKAMAEDQL